MRNLGLLLIAILVAVLAVACAQASPTPTPTPIPTATATLTATPMPTPTFPPMATGALRRMIPESEAIRDLALEICTALVRQDLETVYEHMSLMFKGMCDATTFVFSAAYLDTPFNLLQLDRQALECRVSEVRVQDQRGWVDIDVYEDEKEAMDLVTMEQIEAGSAERVGTHFFENQGQAWYMYHGETNARCEWTRMHKEMMRIWEQTVETP